MNAKHPSQGTQHNHADGATQWHRIALDGFAAAYETPAGAEHRTCRLAASSLDEVFLLTEFTGWAGERIWTDVSGYPFVPARVKLTFRAGTIDRPGLLWLAEHIFELRRIEWLDTDGSCYAGRPTPHTMRTVARQALHALCAVEAVRVEELLARIAAEGQTSAAISHDILAGAIPSDDLPDTVDEFVRTTIRCVHLADQEGHISARPLATTLAAAPGDGNGASVRPA